MAKFLRLFFGCHARPDRSFYFRGKQFPICARCTGELVGMIVCIPTLIFWGCPSFGIVLLLMVPLIIDGSVQKLTSYESGNIRRLISRILFGMALIFTFVYFHRTCVWIAGEILKWFGADPAAVTRITKRIGGF